MRPAEAVPATSAATLLPQAIVAMSKGGLGLIAVLEEERVVGIFTDGDLRRGFERDIDPRAARLADLMTRAPRTIGPDVLAVEAVEMMERFRINALLVTSPDGQLLGALNMHDLFRAKVV
jgi:arabinose-5-phosphate isomerase